MRRERRACYMRKIYFDAKIRSQIPFSRLLIRYLYFEPFPTYSQFLVAIYMSYIT
jgi:hypothetical protein